MLATLAILAWLNFVVIGAVALAAVLVGTGCASSSEEEEPQRAPEPAKPQAPVVPAHPDYDCIEVEEDLSVASLNTDAMHLALLIRGSKWDEIDDVDEINEWIVTHNGGYGTERIDGSVPYMPNAYRVGFSNICQLATGWAWSDGIFRDLHSYDSRIYPRTIDVEINDDCDSDEQEEIKKAFQSLDMQNWDNRQTYYFSVLTAAMKKPLEKVRMIQNKFDYAKIFASGLKNAEHTDGKGERIDGVLTLLLSLAPDTYKDAAGKEHTLEIGNYTNVRDVFASQPGQEGFAKVIIDGSYYFSKVYKAYDEIKKVVDIEDFDEDMEEIDDEKRDLESELDKIRYTFEREKTDEGFRISDEKREDLIQQETSKQTRIKELKRISEERLEEFLDDIGEAEDDITPLLNTIEENATNLYQIIGMSDDWKKRLGLDKKILEKIEEGDPVDLRRHARNPREFQDQKMFVNVMKSESQAALKNLKQMRDYIKLAKVLRDIQADKPEGAKKEAKKSQYKQQGVTPGRGLSTFEEGEL